MAPTAASVKGGRQGFEVGTNHEGLIERSVAGQPARPSLGPAGLSPEFDGQAGRPVVQAHSKNVAFDGQNISSLPENIVAFQSGMDFHPEFALDASVASF